jgi:hypothetical protein
MFHNNFTSLSLNSSQSQSYITTDSQSASPSWCEASIWDPRPIYPLLSLITFKELRAYWCGAPSLTRSLVCSFQFLSPIARAVFLRSESHGTHEHSLLSLFLRIPQPGGPGSCIYFLRNRVAQLYPWALGFIELNSLLYTLYIDTYRIENTSPNSSSIAASRGYRSDRLENAITLCFFMVITWQRPLFTESLLGNRSTR